MSGLNDDIDVYHQTPADKRSYILKLKQKITWHGLYISTIVENRASSYNKHITNQIRGTNSLKALRQKKIQFENHIPHGIFLCSRDCCVPTRTWKSSHVQWMFSSLEDTTLPLPRSRVTWEMLQIVSGRSCRGVRGEVFKSAQKKELQEFEILPYEISRLWFFIISGNIAACWNKKRYEA